MSIQLDGPHEEQRMTRRTGDVTVGILSQTAEVLRRWTAGLAPGPAHPPFGESGLPSLSPRRLGWDLPRRLQREPEAGGCGGMICSLARGAVGHSVGHSVGVTVLKRSTETQGRGPAPARGPRWARTRDCGESRSAKTVIIRIAGGESGPVNARTAFEWVTKNQNRCRHGRRRSGLWAISGLQNRRLQAPSCSSQALWVFSQMPYPSPPSTAMRPQYSHLLKVVQRAGQVHWEGTTCREPHPRGASLAARL